MKNIFKTFFIGIIAIAIISIYGCSEEETTTNNTKKTYEPEMVVVEGGTFIMGCTDEQGSDCRSNELPAHSVTISSFSISKYEITQSQWIEIMGDLPKYGIMETTYLGDNYPVMNMMLEQAIDFCTRLSELTGKHYRLPTEAEWEYAARGGNKSKGYKYSGSDNLDSVGWYIDNSYDSSTDYYKIHPVGEKLPNELGIYDMSGNVMEWCSDFYGPYSEEMQIDPTGPSSSSIPKYSAVVRGGGFSDEAEECRVTFRTNALPNYYAHEYPLNKGIRVVLVD
ncbi:MAG: formylglycine-generating enzyme family protein [Bacteroidales bacterium]|nr:formylglycine-generating enzyme family protein [Bacteroidales bacterium]